MELPIRHTNLSLAHTRACIVMRTRLHHLRQGPLVNVVSFVARPRGYNKSTRISVLTGHRCINMAASACLVSTILLQCNTTRSCQQYSTRNNL